MFRGFSWSLHTEAEKVTALKSIIAYRTGLAINTEVTVKEAEEGLSEVLCGKYGKIWRCNSCSKKIHANISRLCSKYLTKYLVPI